MMAAAQEASGSSPTSTPPSDSEKAPSASFSSVASSIAASSVPSSLSVSASSSSPAPSTTGVIGSTAVVVSTAPVQAVASSSPVQSSGAPTSTSTPATVVPSTSLSSSGPRTSTVTTMPVPPVPALSNALAALERDTHTLAASFVQVVNHVQGQTKQICNISKEHMTMVSRTTENLHSAMQIALDEADSFMERCAELERQMHKLDAVEAQLERTKKNLTLLEAVVHKKQQQQVIK